MELYDVIVIGGGPGGLQAAIHLGRYCWRTLVVDRGKARAYWVPDYLNVLGWPDGVSGQELLKRGREHAAKYGVEFRTQSVTHVSKDPDGLFTVTMQDKRELKKGTGTQSVRTCRARRIVLNTGVMDRHPWDDPRVFFWAGYGIYYCPDCDGYECVDRRVVVVGRGNGGVGMAKALLQWTTRLAVVNVVPGERPVSPENRDWLTQNDIPLYEGKITELRGQYRDRVETVVLEDGTEIACEKVFSALGMYSVNSELARALGCETNDNGYIVVNPRTKETSVPGAWAVGDVVAHSQQVTIAIGEGAQAAIWVNKSLRAEGLLPDHKDHTHQRHLVDCPHCSRGEVEPRLDPAPEDLLD